MMEKKIKMLNNMDLKKPERSSIISTKNNMIGQPPILFNNLQIKRTSKMVNNMKCSVQRLNGSVKNLLSSRVGKNSNLEDERRSFKSSTNCV